MNEADAPPPESAGENSAGDPSVRSGQGTGLPAAPEGGAHLNSAKAAPPLAGDILHGAEEIAEFLYGDRASRRKVYHLVENGHIPFFKLGNNVCTRKSVLLDWISQQERRQTAKSLSEE